MNIGDIVYLKPTGNAARFYKDDIIKGVREAKVNKIGNKYFYLEGYDRYKFEIDGMFSYDNFNSGYNVYLSMQEIYEEQEFERLSSEIKKYFGSYGKLKLSLEQLKQIKTIIDEVV